MKACGDCLLAWGKRNTFRWAEGQLVPTALGLPNNANYNPRPDQPKDGF